jgi:hypothetical protein
LNITGVFEYYSGIPFVSHKIHVRRKGEEWNVIDMKLKEQRALWDES